MDSNKLDVTWLERPSGQNNQELWPRTKEKSNRTLHLSQNNKRMHIHHISSCWRLHRCSQQWQLYERVLWTSDPKNEEKKYCFGQKKWPPQRWCVSLFCRNISAESSWSRSAVISSSRSVENHLFMTKKVKLWLNSCELHWVSLSLLICDWSRGHWLYQCSSRPITDQ